MFQTAFFLSRENEQKKSDTDMYIKMFMLPWSWECVRHTHNHTHTTAHQHAQPKHTNKTPITHHAHTAHTYTTHTHTPPHPHSAHTHTTHTHTHALWVRANMSGPERWWAVPDEGTFSWSLGTILTCKSFVTFRSACFPQDRWSWTILSGKANDRRNRQHVVLDFSQTSTWARSLT